MNKETKGTTDKPLANEIIGWMEEQLAIAEEQGDTARAIQLSWQINKAQGLSDEEINNKLSP